MSVLCVMQHEISLDAYNRLTSTPDAKGRTIEVIKVPVPYPLFRTHKEANGVNVSCLLLLQQLNNTIFCFFALRASDLHEVTRHTKHCYNTDIAPRFQDLQGL